MIMKFSHRVCLKSITLGPSLPSLNVNCCGFEQAFADLVAIGGHSAAIKILVSGKGWNKHYIVTMSVDLTYKSCILSPVTGSHGCWLNSCRLRRRTMPETWGHDTEVPDSHEVNGTRRRRVPIIKDSAGPCISMQWYQAEQTTLVLTATKRNHTK